MSIIAEALASTPEPIEPRRARPNHPKGYEPGYEWDGTRGHIATGPLADRPRTWDEFIRDSGLDPDEVEVLEPVQVRGWDMPQAGGGVVRAHYYRLTVRRRTAALADLDELVKAAKTRRKLPVVPDTAPEAAYVVALGDLQIGKVDGDGTKGTVERFMDGITASVERFKKLAKTHPLDAVYLLHLGDCIEGFQSQGGANAWRTSMTTTEQVRTYRRLVLEQVKAFAGIAPRIVLAGVPGNHDEAHRPLHTYGDSWATEALIQVSDALNLAGNYDHVSVVVPARDELTLTLDIAGTIVGMAHGHQWRAGQATTWWAKQAHGRQPIGDADLLISGHLHHLHVQHTGSDKTWLQLPALESGSQWWKHRTGEWGQPGIVSAVIGGGSWRALEIL